MATIATLCVAMAALVGTLVFGSSLTRLVEDGARYGYNYALRGRRAHRRTAGCLGHRRRPDCPGVVGAMALSQASAPIRGDDVDLVGVEPLRGGLLPVVLAGRFPASPDEVALGELTAPRSTSTSATTSPSTAPTEDRSPTTSSASSCCPPCPSARAAAGAPPWSRPACSGCRRDATATARPPARARHRARTPPLGTEVTPSSGQSRPPDVVNVARARSVPTIIVVVVSLLTFVVLVHALASSVRAAPARRRRPASARRRSAVDHPGRPHPSQRARIDRARDRSPDRHRGRPGHLSRLR